MWFEKSVSNILRARESRQGVLSQALSKGHLATVFLSLNIPGFEKTPPGSEALFFWGLRALSAAFPEIAISGKACDALGHYAILSLDLDPVAVKKRCISLEMSEPFARLIDLDVYSCEGLQIDRGSIGLSGRTCLLCDQPAVECIRAKRHTFEDVIGKIHELLSDFRA